MILGKISVNENKIRMDTEIYCSNCGKKVPGGLTVGEKYSKTESFQIELKNFKKSYRCGICRDKKRREN